MRQPASDLKTQRLSMAAIFLAALIWGAGFIAAKQALNAGVRPALMMMTRFGFAALLTGLLFFKTLRRRLKRRDWMVGGAMGTVLFFAFFTQNTALQYTTPANNAFITGSYVVMVPFIWWAVTRHRPQKVVFLCCLLSFCGVAILSVDTSAGLSLALGDLLTILGSLFYAIHITATSRMARSIHHTALLFMQFCTCSAWGLIFFLITDRDPTPLLRPAGFLPVLYLSVFSTLICYFLQTIGQKNVPSAKAGIILATEALFGAFFSVLLGFDKLTLRMVAGGLLMFLSIILPELWEMGHRRGAAKTTAAESDKK